MNRRETHNRYQQDVFAKEVGSFCEPIPQAIRQRLRQIVEQVQLAKDERVLDVGTGTGVLIPYIQTHGVQQIVGCDLSATMLEIARKHHPDVIFWCGDVVDLPADLGPFDAVFLNAMFGNVWDQNETLAGVCDLLTKAGRVCISHPLGAGYVAGLHRSDSRRTPYTLPDQDRLLEMVQRSKLRLVHYQDDPELYLVILGKD